MKNIITSDRFILREIKEEDALGIFELDSDLDVHQYLGKKPMQSMEQAHAIVEKIQRQYDDYGIGRWAIIDPEENDFIGWTGFKYMDVEVNNHIGYYDLGYRLRQKYWGMGIATESGKAVVKYGFENLNFKEIYAMAECLHQSSINVLTKLGMKRLEVFDYEGDEHFWFKQEKSDWLMNQHYLK